MEDSECEEPGWRSLKTNNKKSSKGGEKKAGNNPPFKFVYQRHLPNSVGGGIVISRLRNYK